MTRFTCALALVLAAGALAAIPDEAAGCAAVPHHDESVQTADESALIVWDEKPRGDGPGGTSDFQQKVCHLGGQVEIINPTKLP